MRSVSELDRNDDVVQLLTQGYEPDQVIAFGSRRPTKKGTEAPHYFAAVRAGDYRAWLPQLRAYERAKAKTAYWILHPMKPSLEREPPTEENGFQVRYFHAADKTVDALANVYLDLDVGRPGLPTAGAAIGMLMDAVLAGQIPAPTCTAQSGRGAYAVWALRQTVPHTPSSRTRWKSILQRLLSITSRLGLEPDEVATNLSRWMKYPGTIDTKTSNKVIYSIHSVDGAAPPLYSLDELEKALGIFTAPSLPVAAPAPSPPVAAPAPSLPVAAPAMAPQIRNRNRRTDGRNGSYLHQRRRREIEALSNLRGGMREGVRKMTLFFYFGSLRSEYLCLHAGQHEQAHDWAKRRTYELNRTFSPPLSDTEVENAIQRKRGGDKARWCANTLATCLHVTQHEAEELDLLAIAPQEIRAQHAAKKQQQAEQRRAKKKLLEADVLYMIDQRPQWSDADIARRMNLPRHKIRYLRFKRRTPSQSSTPQAALLPGMHG